MSPAHLLTLFPRLRVLVVGDLMLDHYVWGDVSRISPEAPVPVVLVERDSFTAGGAANVAHNLSALGLSVEVVGIFGEEEDGRRLSALLAEHHVAAKRCVVSAEVPTIVKTRVMARKQQVCRIDREGARARYMRIAEAQMLPLVLEALAGGVDAVIVSDYAKGTISQAMLCGLIEAAKAHDVLVAVDPKPARKLDLNGVGLLTPNRHEALELAGLTEPTVGEPYPLAAVCAAIYERFAPVLLVVTLGPDGMALSRGGLVEHVVPTAAREVYDVSGAGDTVIATLTAALAAGADPLEAVHLANQAAGIVVSKLGTAVVTRDELLAQLRTT